MQRQQCVGAITASSSSGSVVRTEHNPDVDRATFAHVLADAPMLADGGMGTSLVDRGVPVDSCLELRNVEDPDVVLDVHRSFTDAGAGLVWTNTFGANRFKLARYGLADRAGEINVAGVMLARKLGVPVVGSLGPLGVRLVPVGRVAAEQARQAYAEQIGALLEAGADVLAIETQTDLDEIEEAVAAARELDAGVPVLVTATFTRDDRTLLGTTPEAVARRLASLGVDALGVNCGQGPEQALRVIRQMAPESPVPLVARPNAGGPQQVGGRLLYPATPAYFAEHARELLDAGVRLIGGCCGTGPAHTRAMARAMAGAPPVSLPARPPSRLDTQPAAPAPGTSGLATKLDEGRFVVAVEMEPPRGHSAATMLAAAETLGGAGADVIDVADSPMARMRMSPWAACRLIEQELGIETVLHFPTRGRNLLRLQGDLLAVHALGVRNLFVCLGDPVAIGDFPQGTDNVDATATGLIELVTRSFNRGTDHAGSPIGEPTSFVVGCALNPDPADPERECRLLRRKIDAGAAFALTQPIYEPGRLDRFRQQYERRHGALDLPILAGVLPLVSARHATFLDNEVPGVTIPPAVLDRIRRAPQDRAAAQGTAMALELVAAIRERAAGIYLMPQFGRFDLAAEVVEAAANG
jgi:methionine synthase / methylenetetrahydrofolate reductase (NADH)